MGAVNLDDLFRHARADHRRGAGEIERDLIASLIGARPWWRPAALRSGASGLLDAHPEMANLRHLGDLLRASDLDQVEHRLRRRLEVLDNLDALLGRSGAALLGGCARVVTVSRSSSVAAVLRGAAASGWRGEVVVLDGTSSGCGPKQAETLRDAGLDARSWPDGAVRWALDGDGDVVVVVGADAVAPSRFVNATGSRPLCELAAVSGVAVAVVADTGKDLSEDAVGAILGAGRMYREPGPGRCWPVFEAVPVEYADERVSEHGRTALR
jgi:translation initiation factor 2B subunit (eIF-2B alpha/beta/delta family)